MDTDTMHVVFIVQRTCGCRQIAPIQFLTVYYNCESLLACPTSRKDRHSTIQSSNSRGLVFAAASPRLAKFSIRRTTCCFESHNQPNNQNHCTRCPAPTRSLNRVGQSDVSTWCRTCQHVSRCGCVTAMEQGCLEQRPPHRPPTPAAGRPAPPLSTQALVVSRRLVAYH